MSHILLVTPKLFWLRREVDFSEMPEPMRDGGSGGAMCAPAFPVRRCMPGSGGSGTEPSCCCEASAEEKRKDGGSANIHVCFFARSFARRPSAYINVHI